MPMQLDLGFAAPAPVRAPSPASIATATAATTRRLFIGLVPEASTQRAIDAARGGWRWSPRTRFTPAGRFHLTLLFDGQSSTAAEAAMRRTLDTLACAPWPAIDLALRPAPVWRNHVAVLLPDPNDDLRRLHGALRDALHDALAESAAYAPANAQCRTRARAGSTHGLPAPWTPHLTLAHDADGSMPPRDAGVIACRIREVVLVWSQLPPAFGRARHVVLERKALSE